MLEVVVQINLLEAKHWTDGVLRPRENGRSLLPTAQCDDSVPADEVCQRLNQHLNDSADIPVTTIAPARFWHALRRSKRRQYGYANPSTFWT